MRAPFALRFVLTALAALTLVAIVQGHAPVANAGATATFAPDPLEILDGASGNLTVTVVKEVTQGEVDDGKIRVDLVEPGGIDEVIQSKDATIPAGTVAGDTVTVSVTFRLKCVDGEIEGTGEGSIDFMVEFGSTVFNATGSGTVECLGVALVTFDPDPLEIEEGAEEKVSVKFTKHLTLAEANARQVTVRLMHQGTDTLLGEKKVRLAGQLRVGKKVTRTTSFQLQCKNDEIRGVNGTGLPSAPLSVEFTVDGEDAGDGLALCIGRTSLTVPSSGSRPSDLFVDEQTGLMYALNASDGAIGVFDGTTLIRTNNLPCEAAPGALSMVEPGGNDCLFQSFYVRALPDGTFKIVVVDFQRFAVHIFFPNNARVAGAPQVIEIPVGDSPTGAVLDPVSGHFYVTNSGDGTVSVIDLEAALVVDTINVGGVPRSAAADPEAGIVYVTDFTGDALIVIDTETNTVADTIAVGNGAEGVTVDPETGDVYVTNFIGDSLSVISGAAGVAAAPSGAVQVQTVPVGDGPIDVDVNPFTNRIFVVNANDDTMSVIDRTALEVTATLPTGKTPDAVAVSQGKGLVYIANHDANSLTIYSDTSHFTNRRWGDMNCNGNVGPGDVLVILLTAGDVPSDGVPGCPGVGQPVGVFGFPEQDWGDHNCNDLIDGFDALLLILASAGANVPAGGPNCPDVNELVDVY